MFGYCVEKAVEVLRMSDGASALRLGFLQHGRDDRGLGDAICCL
jgi:hypothetical protein